MAKSKTKGKPGTPPDFIIGIDPGTGASSPLGVSFFNPHTKELQYTKQIGSSHKKLEHRIKQISDELEVTFIEIGQAYEGLNITVYVESFVMRGKAGESLQRMIGSILGRIPYKFEVRHIQNTTVKLMLAEHGHANKKAVAEGVAYFFKEHTPSAYKVRGLIESEAQWDVLDSLAIGIAGWMYHQAIPQP